LLLPLQILIALIGPQRIIWRAHIMQAEPGGSFQFVKQRTEIDAAVVQSHSKGAGMSSNQNTVDYLVEQMADAGAVSAKKMFGEYGIFCDGKMVAIVGDDQLFVKPTAAGRAFLQSVEEVPPYPGAKPYFFISGEQWDDAEWLSELIRLTSTELPLPKKKNK
jgi:TfoX/Sxy family transcriptional regulator of competence genes